MGAADDGAPLARGKRTTEQSRDAYEQVGAQGLQQPSEDGGRRIHINSLKHYAQTPQVRVVRGSAERFLQQSDAVAQRIDREGGAAHVAVGWDRRVSKSTRDPN